VETETLYYMYNGHGDVTALIDNTGYVQASYYYDAFGTPMEEYTNENGKNNPIRYAGYQYDRETGLYYLNARYYDSKIARFLSEDTYRGSAADPLSLNLYTYCHNEPIMYWDPSGHWEQGDEDLNEEAKAKIIALTSAYYEASTKVERDAIHQQADAIRNDKASQEAKVTPLKTEAEKAITATVKKGIAKRGHMTKDEWVTTINSVGITYTVNTSYNINSGGVRKESNTVTSIGRTDIGVNVNSNLITKTASASMSMTYNLSYNEANFVNSVISKSDISLEQSICLLDILEMSDGKITDSDLQGIVGDNYFTPEKWYEKLFDISTADMLELEYRATSNGYSIAEIDYMMQQQRLNEVYNLMYFQAFCVASNANLNIGPRDPYFMNVNGKKVAYTNPSGYIHSPYQTSGAPGSYITINSSGYSIATKGAGSKISSKGINDLPSNVQNSYNQYNKSGWKGNVAGQTSGTKAGGTYQNSNGALPKTDSAGKPITYREFDVNNKLPSANRDAQRFISGSDGSIYYTDSHYGDIVSPTGLPSFVKLK
jgi:RHS repeat-associated protein